MVKKKMSGNIRVIIVDDLPETRENVRKLLQFESDIEVIGQAGTGEEAVQMAKEHQPDIILMDINMPGIDGIGASQQITESVPTVQIIIMSVQSDPNYLRRAMMAGARDFLTKPFGGDEVVAAIRRVHDKRPFITAKSTSKIPKLFYRPKKSTTEIQSKLTRLEAETTFLNILKLTEKIELFSHSLTEGHLVDQMAQITAGMAHDLRSPINLIITILDSIDDQEISSSPENIKKHILRVWKRIYYCKWLIDNFLGVSFNEQHSRKTISIRKSIEFSLNLIKPRFISAEIKISIPYYLKLQTDSRVFDLLILNIITNAFEEMPEGGQLFISSAKNETDVSIIIEDSGSMGPPEYFRIGYSTKPAHCGLGLYVAKRLIEQQLGEINFYRSSILRGTKVVLTFPRNRSFRQEFLELQDYIIHTHNKTLDNYLTYLEEKLNKFRKSTISEKNKEYISKEFKRITLNFARNLYNELSFVDSAAKEILSQINSLKLSKAFKKITHNCSYSQLLVRNMIEIGESTNPSLSSVNVASIIDEVLELLERKIPPQLFRINWDVDLTIGNIEADEIQMKQIFMNLIKNALDAMPNGGVLTIRLSQIKTFILVEIKDTGVGISNENLSKLFKLGFTTKPNGYGIGLYSISTIVKKHRGRISASSQLGKGATFTVLLPINQTGVLT
ncbi:ATP-binding protein [Candidatus Leptofilum sp.]|uniref:ATP-binding protein n=1 Tax=Candidatus Leptofilum sp. TaxID=3241576 RepID=UPI003B5ABF04